MRLILLNANSTILNVGAT